MLYLSLRPLSWYVSCFPGFPSNPCFLRQNPVLPGILRVILRVLRGGGGPCMASRRLQPLTWCYPGVRFNLLARSPIPVPIPVPVLAGDWWAELNGSSVSRTSKRWFRCVRLPTPVLAKGFLNFYLPWLDLIDRARLGLPSLEFLPLKEQKGEKYFRWSLQCLPCLSFLIFSHLSRSYSIG